MKDITHHEEFERVVASSDAGLTLVDFHAQWCGPCKMVAPILANIAEIHEGTLDVVKVDADALQEVTAKYGVRGIPTLMLFNAGEPVATKVGALSLKQLEAFIAPYIAA